MSTALENLGKIVEGHSSDATELSVHDLLNKISADVKYYLTNASPQKRTEIIATLDRIKSKITGLSRDQIVSLLTDIYKVDTDLWDRHMWEDFDFRDTRQHEKNEEGIFQKIGIKPEVLMRYAERTRETDKRLILVLQMAYIYGLTSQILLNR